MKLLLIVAAVIVAGVAALALALAYAIVNTPPGPAGSVVSASTPEPPSRPTAVLDAAAYVTPACEDAVKEKLPTPATAHFPFGNSEDVEAGPAGLFRMNSTVEWTSPAGVPMRSRFVCDATERGQVKSVLLR